MPLNPLDEKLFKKLRKDFFCEIDMEPGENSTWDNFSQSRSLIQTSFDQKEIELNSCNWRFDLPIEGFKCSLAHTENCCCFLLINEEDYSGVQSVGVDVESVGREISDLLQTKYIRSIEKNLWEPLELWVIKEACYKAISSYDNRTFDLIDICVAGPNFFFIEDEKVSGRFISWKDGGYYFAVAFVYI